MLMDTAMENDKLASKLTGISSLPTLQQRRLRHLRSVAARNIQLKKKRATLDVTQLQMCFTLHVDETSSPFYTSEKISGSLNPVWKTFSIVHATEEINVDTTSQSLTVRVWYGQTSQADDDYDCCIRWTLHLSGLGYLGNKILNEHNQHASNTLIFGLQDGFYGAPTMDKTTINSLDMQSFTSEADSSVIRQSYSIGSLMRVQTIIRAMKQTQRGVTRERQSIESRLSEMESMRRKRAQRELSLLKVSLIRSDLQWRITQMQNFEQSYEMQQVENIQREVSLKNRHEKLANDSEELHERKKRYFDVRDELIKTGAQLVVRRKQLLSELAFIYPIQRIPNNEDNICGVHLPHSEDFSGHDETQIAVALGYTCHLVLMISNFLDIPLRYPMSHHGSRSMIYDHIIDKLSEKERDFPLFSKGKEKFQFQYGVYIMNKNIAQLRYYCGMSTSDLRPTLANISTLLCDKLGVTYNHNDAFYNQHLLIPPSFGGPQKSNPLLFPLPGTSHSQSGHLSDMEKLEKVGVGLPSFDLSFPSIRSLDDIRETKRNAVDADSELPSNADHRTSVQQEMSVESLNNKQKNDVVFTSLNNDEIACDDDLSASTTCDNIKPVEVDSNDEMLKRSSDRTCIYQRIDINEGSENICGWTKNANVVTPNNPVVTPDDLDASSTEESDSVVYRSHFGNWDAALLVEEELDASRRSPTRCDVDGYGGDDDTCRKSQERDGFYDCDETNVNCTFKTWGKTNKGQGNELTSDENGQENQWLNEETYLEVDGFASDNGV